MSNLIPSKGDNLVPLIEAKNMIAKFRVNVDNILAADYKNKDILFFSETMNADDMRLLLSQPDCVGFRIYSGMDDMLRVHSILVGVNSTGNDIYIKNLGGELSGDEEFVLEHATRCPPDCPTI